MTHCAFSPHFSFLRPIAALGLSAFVSLASAEPIGTAESQAAYELTKAANSATLTVTGTSVVEDADAVAARDEVVQLALGEGDVVLVDRDSSARVESKDRVSLTKGNLLAATSPASGRGYEYQGLLVESVPASGEAVEGSQEKSILLMSEVEPEAVNIAALNGGYAVRDTASKERIAYLGNGDAMQFRRVNEVWILQSQPIASPFEAPAGVTDGSLNYDLERGAYIWWGGGALAGIGGGLLLLDLLTDDDGGDDGDDDDDSEDRPPFSAIY